RRLRLSPPPPPPDCLPPALHDALPIYRLLAYHDWANGRFLDAAAALPEAAWTRDLGSSFPSVQATMAHAIGAEWVWLRRWQGEADRKSTRLNSSHVKTSYAVFCLKRHT